MKIEFRSPAAVKPYPGNPSVDDDIVSEVAWSIREIGFCNPILVDEKDEVISGHIRLAAAQSLGMAEVPVVVCDSLSSDQIRALRLADSQSLAMPARREEERAHRGATRKPPPATLLNHHSLPT